MCLIIDTKNRYTPYNRKNIRYKVLKDYSSWGGKDTFLSPVKGGTIWKKGEWNKAKGNRKAARSFGFHVFTDYNEAKNYLMDYDDCVCRVSVRGFLRRGRNYEETWEYCRLDKVLLYN